MHAKPDLRVFLKMDDLSFRLGDRGRYLAKAMNEPRTQKTRKRLHFRLSSLLAAIADRCGCLDRLEQSR